jgi:hypothetical protein
MGSVFFMRDPFKIFGTVVCPVEVLVVHARLATWVGDKRFSYEPMQIMTFAL